MAFREVLSDEQGKVMCELLNEKTKGNWSCSIEERSKPLGEEMIFLVYERFSKKHKRIIIRGYMITQATTTDIETQVGYIVSWGVIEHFELSPLLEHLLVETIELLYTKGVQQVQGFYQPGTYSKQTLRCFERVGFLQQEQQNILIKNRPPTLFTNCQYKDDGWIPQDLNMERFVHKTSLVNLFTKLLPLSLIDFIISYLVFSRHQHYLIPGVSCHDFWSLDNLLVIQDFLGWTNCQLQSTVYLVRHYCCDLSSFDSKTREQLTLFEFTKTYHLKRIESIPSKKELEELRFLICMD